ncbi:unnamed protein product, partial [Gulo gulo]
TFASGLFLNDLCLDKHRTAFLGFLPIWSREASCYIGKTSTGLHRRMNKKNGLLSSAGEKPLKGFQVHRALWRKHLIGPEQSGRIHYSFPASAWQGCNLNPAQLTADFLFWTMAVK